jgi:RNA polymerase sigma factor (sigma-70 family)
MAHLSAVAARTRRRSSSVLGAYARTFGPRGILGRAEELELVERARRGDTDALSALIRAHFPLTVKIALGFEGRGLAMEDILGEACVGLMEAVERFRPELGTRFMTYATWWIRCAVARAVLTQSRNVRLPRRRARCGQGYLPEVSLSESIPGTEAVALAEKIADATPGSERLVEDRERDVALRRALATLPARERVILERRFGLGQADACSLQALADDMGISKERVRQLEQQAMTRLREGLAVTLPGFVASAPTT